MGRDVGIVDIGLYFPETTRPFTEIAALSGIPENVVRDKFGINQVYVPGPNDHTSDMAIRATEDCLERAGIDPDEIDLVIYFGENYSDFQIYSVAPRVMDAIGIRNAWSYDMECKCGSFVVALDQAKLYLTYEEQIDTVLVVGGYRNIDKVNYIDPAVSFLFDVSAGGAAAVVRRDVATHTILRTASISDPRFSNSVAVRGGGTRIPFTPQNAGDPRLQYFTLEDPERFRRLIGTVSIDNLVSVTREACRKSGLSLADIDFVCPLHMKRSAHLQLLEGLGICKEQAFYLSDYGHCGQLDGAIALRRSAEAGLIKAGDVVAIVAMGLGYSWNAGIIIW